MFILDSLFNSNELLSVRVLPSFETLTEEPMELAVISNFHHRRPHGGSNSGPFDPKLNAFNYLTTDPRMTLSPASIRRFEMY